MQGLKRQLIMLLIMAAFVGGAYAGAKFARSPLFIAARKLYGDLAGLAPPGPTARVAITPAELERMIDEGEITVEIDGESYVVFVGEDELDDSVRQAAAGVPEDTRHRAVQDVLLAAMPRKPPKPTADSAAPSAPAPAATADRPAAGSLEAILGGLGVDLSGEAMGGSVSETFRQAMEQARRHVDGEQ